MILFALFGYNHIPDTILYLIQARSDSRHNLVPYSGEIKFQAK